MLRLLTILTALALCCAPALHAQTTATIEAQQLRQEQQPQQPQQPERVQATQVSPVMREYRGVKLGMNRAQVKDVMKEAAQAGKDQDEFKLGDGDLMTIRYDDQGVVNTIQLYFTDPGRAPKWTEVVGNAEIQEQPTGSKHARAVNEEENFWVTMFQSKSRAVTTITLSR